MKRCRMNYSMVAVVVLAATGAMMTPGTSWAQAQPGVDSFFPDEADPLVGDWIGRWSEHIDVDPDVAAQVIPLGNDNYRIVMVAKLDLRAPPKAVIETKAKDGKLSFSEQGMRGEISGDSFTGGNLVGDATFSMKKVNRESPTMGKVAPDGAIVLFDGKNLDAWDGTDGWELTDGVLMVTPKGKYLESKQKFTDVELHIEFRTPLMASARGQQRGNSGVFLQDIYEVQVLDSYGLEGHYDECGALYKLSAPRVNACYPPLQWQTYDITYTAPQYDASGKLSENGRMTVHHNGVLIQDDIELKWRTDWKEVDRLKPPPTEPGRIRLQGHNNYVQFRNVWVVDKAK